MAKLDLQLRRTAHPIRGTHWRPPSHVERHGEVLTLEQLRDLLSSGSLSPQPIAVEDPYKRQRLAGEFVIDPLSLVIMHRTTREMPMSTYVRLAPLVLVAAGVKFGEGVSVGTRSELRPGSSLEGGVRVGRYAVVGKGAQLGRCAMVGGGAYTAAGVQLMRDAALGIRSTAEKGCVVAQGAVVGLHSSLQRGAFIGPGAVVGDEVRAGRFVRIHDGAIIGDEVDLSPYAVIGAGAVVGAGATVGECGAVMPTGWVRPGEHIPGRYELSQKNLN